LVIGYIGIQETTQLVEDIGIATTGNKVLPLSEIGYFIQYLLLGEGI
jgi:hypothetical protein